MNNRNIGLLMAGAAGLIGLMLVGSGGCSREHFKAEADQEAYEIIEEKWSPEIGTQANVRISDVAAGDDDLAVELDLSAEEYQILSLVDSVALATANNRDYQRQKEDLYLTALDLSLVRHNFDMQFFGFLGGGYSHSSSDESIDADGTLGFDQLLADGARVTTSLGVDWLRFLTGDPRQSLGSVLSATVTQPLMRGARRKIVQENLTQAERNMVYQLRSFNRFRKQFVVGIIDDYYSVLQALDTVSNQELNYLRALDTYDRNKALEEAGRLDRIQLDQAETRQLEARDSWVQAQQRYEDQLDRFKISLALPTDALVELDPNELEALEEAGLGEIEFTAEEAAEIALEERLDLMTTEDQVEDARRRVDVAADSLRMRMNLIGSANADSPEGQQPARIEFQNGTYALGLDADLDLDRKAERNAYREALITLEQRVRAYDQQRDEVKLQVRQEYRRLEQEAQSYDIQTRTLKLAKDRVDNANLSMQAGRIQVRDLLEAQDSLLDSENAVTDALVAYTVAKLDFYRDIGILQVRNDGFWETQTP